MATFLTTVQILGGLMIALGMFYIAFQQHKTAKAQHQTAQDKLKLDLFDRRYKVYRGLMDLLCAIAQNGAVSNKDLGAFFRDTDQKRFLFNDDICDYLMLIRQKAVELRHAQRVLVMAREDRGRMIGHQQIVAAGNTDTKLLGWFDEQADQASKKFEGYLGFKKAL